MEGDAAQTNVLILGIGNLLWADEGFGVRAIEELNRLYEFGDNVKLMDGGTQGIYLVQHVRDADILVVFDAVDYGLEPGTLKLVEGDEVPRFLGAKKVSLHQTGFQEVLAMAEMFDEAPSHLFLIGVQPKELEDYGGSLRDVVKAQITPSIDEALSFLKKHGIEGQKRAQPLDHQHTLGCQVMQMERYENERPAEAEACRVGDERLINDSRWKAPEDFDGELEAVLAEDTEGRILGVPV
ncbi:HyaD/HybD family hydrogenase maturation endopeptidase [Terasakiella sp. SH-1]|uniref:HyaD/HybD family hydrogenase maturation endopeptidase n=1 Tax=Terasakiella sp. SH-1 TaxID=2560057 RepID=UPI001074590D|nr:HyaD/HybD family hydrogenase maturation endopeptidase [Terasakiella sp. SH-1]